MLLRLMIRTEPPSVRACAEQLRLRLMATLKQATVRAVEYRPPFVLQPRMVLHGRQSQLFLHLVRRPVP